MTFWQRCQWKAPWPLAGRFCHAVVQFRRAFFVAMLISVITSLPACQAAPPPADRLQVSIRGHRFRLEHATDYAKGLAGRRLIAPRGGMWFAFSPPEAVQFWMHGCLVPLDMLFIRDRRIIQIIHQVPPCLPHGECPSYGPPVAVDAVMEIAGGQAEALGLRAGDPISVQP